MVFDLRENDYIVQVNFKIVSYLSLQSSKFQVCVYILFSLQARQVDRHCTVPFLVFMEL